MVSSKHWPLVFSSVHGQSCYPGRRASRPRPETVDPQTALHSVDTASWGWSNAAPQRPSQTRTSFSLQRDNTNRERHANVRQMQFRNSTRCSCCCKDLITFFFRNICAYCMHDFLAWCLFILLTKTRRLKSPVLSLSGGFMHFLEVWTNRF